MPYYPTAAFFKDEIRLHEIAYSFLDYLDDKTTISFKVTSDSEKQAVSTFSKFSKFSKTDAISFLDGCPSIYYFSVKDPLNSVLFESYNASYLEIKFWDFDRELYDTNSITQSMQNQKRKFCISMHETLLKYCGAKLSFTNSLDNKRYECEFDDDFDVASFISDNFKRNQLDKIINLPQTTSYIWLLGIQRDTLPTGVLNEEIMQGFKEVKNDEKILILESVINQPTFMNDRSNDPWVRRSELKP